jgi:Sec-independent protein translocase protein TatA
MGRPQLIQANIIALQELLIILVIALVLFGM